MGSCLSRLDIGYQKRPNNLQLNSDHGALQTEGRARMEGSLRSTLLPSPTTDNTADHERERGTKKCLQGYSSLVASLNDRRMPTVLLALHRTGSSPEGTDPYRNIRARPPASVLLEVPVAQSPPQQASITSTGNGRPGTEVQLLLGPPADQAASVVMRCTGANEVAVRTLDLGIEKSFLHILARCFDQDVTLRTFFYDFALRLLLVPAAGLGRGAMLDPVHHFIPTSHLSPDGYLCHLRVSGVQYVDDGVGNGTGASEKFDDSGPEGGRALVRALVLELGVPYERQDISARLQRDYLMLSSIPSIVTIFDIGGFVLHQNAASVQFMGFRVGLGRRQQPHEEVPAVSSEEAGTPSNPQGCKEAKIKDCEEIKRRNAMADGSSRGEHGRPTEFEAAEEISNASVLTTLGADRRGGRSGVPCAALPVRYGDGSSSRCRGGGGDGTYDNWLRDVGAPAIALATFPVSVHNGGSNDVRSVAAVCWESSPTLLRLFGADPERLEDALQAVKEGREWCGLVRMPSWLSQGTDAAPNRCGAASSSSFGPPPLQGQRLEVSSSRSRNVTGSDPVTGKASVAAPDTSSSSPSDLNGARLSHSSARRDRGGAAGTGTGADAAMIVGAAATAAAVGRCVVRKRSTASVTPLDEEEGFMSMLSRGGSSSVKSYHSHLISSSGHDGCAVNLINSDGPAGRSTETPLMRRCGELPPPLPSGWSMISTDGGGGGGCSRSGSVCSAAPRQPPKLIATLPEMFSTQMPILEEEEQQQQQSQQLSPPQQPQHPTVRSKGGFSDSGGQCLERSAQRAVSTQGCFSSIGLIATTATAAAATEVGTTASEPDATTATRASSSTSTRPQAEDRCVNPGQDLGDLCMEASQRNPQPGSTASLPCVAFSRSALEVHQPMLRNQGITVQQTPSDAHSSLQHLRPGSPSLPKSPCRETAKDAAASGTMSLFLGDSINVSGALSGATGAESSLPSAPTAVWTHGSGRDSAEWLFPLTMLPQVTMTTEGPHTSTSEPDVVSRCLLRTPAQKSYNGSSQEVSLSLPKHPSVSNQQSVLLRDARGSSSSGMLYGSVSEGPLLTSVPATRRVRPSKGRSAAGIVTDHASSTTTPSSEHSRGSFPGLLPPASSVLQLRSPSAALSQLTVAHSIADAPMTASASAAVAGPSAAAAAASQLPLSRSIRCQSGDGWIMCVSGNSIQGSGESGVGVGSDIGDGGPGKDITTISCEERRGSDVPVTAFPESNISLTLRPSLPQCVTATPMMLRAFGPLSAVRAATATGTAAEEVNDSPYGDSSGLVKDLCQRCGPQNIPPSRNTNGKATLAMATPMMVISGVTGSDITMVRGSVGIDNSSVGCASLGSSSIGTGAKGGSDADSVNSGVRDITSRLEAASLSLPGASRALTTGSGSCGISTRIAPNGSAILRTSTSPLSQGGQLPLLLGTASRDSKRNRPIRSLTTAMLSRASRSVGGVPGRASFGKCDAEAAATASRHLSSTQRTSSSSLHHLRLPSNSRSQLSGVVTVNSTLAPCGSVFGSAPARRNYAVTTTASRQRSASPLEHRQRLQKLVRALSIHGSHGGVSSAGEGPEASTVMSQSLAGLLAMSPLCIGQGTSGGGGAGGLYGGAQSNDDTIGSDAFTLGTMPALEPFCTPCGMSGTFTYGTVTTTLSATVPVVPQIATPTMLSQPLAVPQLPHPAFHDCDSPVQQHHLLRSAAAQLSTGGLARSSCFSPEPAPSAWAALSTAATTAVNAAAAAEVPMVADRWHEVTIRGCCDPLGSNPVLLVIQTDVTRMVEAEAALVEILEAEHRLLADIFPMHVVQHMTQRRWQQAQHEKQAGRTRPRGGRGGGEREVLGLGLIRNLQDPLELATSHESISVLFADIRGFTEMSKQVSPVQVMDFLNQLFTLFDSLTDVYGVYKVETIGDCYMVAGGLVTREGSSGDSGNSEGECEGAGQVAIRQPWEVDPHHASRVVAFARAMLRDAACVKMPSTGQPVQLRIGIHSGPATSGVVGQKMPRFCLFGDTVNTASRMESTGRAGAVHVSAPTRALLPSSEDQLGGWGATGGVEVKGKGVMETYLWTPQAAITATDMRRHDSSAKDSRGAMPAVGSSWVIRGAAPGAANAATANTVIGGSGAGRDCNKDPFTTSASALHHLPEAGSGRRVSHAVDSTTTALVTRSGATAGLTYSASTALHSTSTITTTRFTAGTASTSAASCMNTGTSTAATAAAGYPLIGESGVHPSSRRRQPLNKLSP